MDVDKIETIESFFEEIKYLKNRSQLLDEILKYWSKETMTIDVPEKWKNQSKMAEEQLSKIPKSPRHDLNKKIFRLLPSDEYDSLVNYEKMHEHASNL